MIKQAIKTLMMGGAMMVLPSPKHGKACHYSTSRNQPALPALNNKILTGKNKREE